MDIRIRRMGRNYDSLKGEPMSFIIKGFDIPKDAVYFKLSFYDGNRENEYGVSGSLKPYIIQIPKGHGRIVDVNDLKADMRLYESKYCGEQGYITEDDIDDAPTILEAEK